MPAEVGGHPPTPMDSSFLLLSFQRKMLSTWNAPETGRGEERIPDIPMSGLGNFEATLAWAVGLWGPFPHAPSSPRLSGFFLSVHPVLHPRSLPLGTGFGSLSPGGQCRPFPR